MFQLLFVIVPSLVAALLPLPPVLWSDRRNTTPGYSLEAAQKTIYIDRQFADTRDSEGLTLIPPSALEFAETFIQDIATIFGGSWTLQEVDVLPASGIRLGRYRDDASQLTYENGLPTEEGYEVEIGNGSVYIGGSGSTLR